MKITYRSYPHPVLSHFSDDLIECAFQATVTVDTTRTFYKLQIATVLSNRDLKQLINSGQAEYALHIESGATRYRRFVTSGEPEFAFDVPTSAVEGVVDVCVLIVARDDIPDYRNGKFHPDYEDRGFAVSKGDVLAVAEDRTFLADNERDQLRRIPSIFEVARTTDRDANAMDIDLMGNKIAIQLRSADYDRYCALVPASDLEPVLASVVAIPVLVEVLETMITSTDADQDYGNYRWYRVLKSKLTSEGVDFSSGEYPVSTVAMIQKLLDSPVSSALTAVKTMAERINRDGNANPERVSAESATGQYRRKYRTILEG